MLGRDIIARGTPISFHHERITILMLRNCSMSRRGGSAETSLTDSNRTTEASKICITSVGS